jgi:hypothetical protein
VSNEASAYYTAPARPAKSSGAGWCGSARSGLRTGSRAPAGQEELKLLDALLARLGRRLVKVDETIVLPRPLRASAVSCGRGVDWNLESADSFARGALPGAARDLAAAVAAGRAHGYVESNPYFGFADAAVAYALVRERRPGLVVEVGGGYSSRVLRTALDASGGGRLVTIDPSRGPI